MGLTKQSMGTNIIKTMPTLKDMHNENSAVIALAGNPNTGKSTVFNSLTGMKQHTGNWPGKTVATAFGSFEVKDSSFLLVDLPGTYSLLANSAEEEIARDFICFDKPDATVVVTDATCLERNLNLALQILEITSSVILCINLIDEANRKGISVNTDGLSEILGIPVIATNARDGVGLHDLKSAIYDLTMENTQTNPYRIQYDQSIEEAIEKLESLLPSPDPIYRRWAALRLMEGDIDLGLDQDTQHKINRILKDLNMNRNKNKDLIATSIVKQAEAIAKQTVSFKHKTKKSLDDRIDDIITSKLFGIPIMLLMLGVIFWITIEGANYPSHLLYNGFFTLEGYILSMFRWLKIPKVLQDMLIFGVYRTLAWVISVMLPPMAIFFPLFTLLEDLGYLPRVAFNLDSFFKRAGAHGKQSLTMCMGFGCNAAGVISCRIIDSPRERLIAIITNNFVPCNGRFPLLIAISSIFLGGLVNSQFTSLIAALTILGTVIIGIFVTLIVSKIMSNTLLKGVPSSFSLELPPYRRPQIGRIIVRSVFDRTLFVLGRAVAVAAPAGLVIWLMANISIGGDMSILDLSANFLDPLGKAIGMDGYILMAFILGFPANEIVIPIMIMGYTRANMLIDMESLDALRELFILNGWSYLTGICVMLFSLLHFPCGTTLLTIKKETGSNKWTFLSFVIPTVIGMGVCFIITQIFRGFGLA